MFHREKVCKTCNQSIKLVDSMTTTAQRSWKQAQQTTKQHSPQLKIYMSSPSGLHIFDLHQRNEHFIPAKIKSSISFRQNWTDPFRPKWNGPFYTGWNWPLHSSQNKLNHSRQRRMDHFNPAGVELTVYFQKEWFDYSVLVSYGEP